MGEDKKEVEMASMSISLSDKMRGFIKSRVESGDYHNESEYIRDLVRRDSEKQVEEQTLLNLLAKSENSGESDLSVLDIMKDVKQRLKADGRL